MTPPLRETVGKCPHVLMGGTSPNWPCPFCTQDALVTAVSEVAALRERLARVQAWQPIKTAPKDGTWIIAFVPSTGRSHAVQWDKQFDLARDDEEDDAGYRGAWTDHAVQSFGYEELKEYVPTHWMPLPEAPSLLTDAPSAQEKKP